MHIPYQNITKINNMKTLYAFLFLLPVVLSSGDSDWESFKLNFGRKYLNSHEEAYRKRVFLQNKQFIDNHNQKHADGQSTFTLAINQFADMTNEEFRASLPTIDENQALSSANKVTEYKSSGLGFNVVTVDWRQVGCVGLVKDQSDCTGGGWAFSVNTCLEFINCRVTGIDLLYVRYSEQNLLDCTTSYGNDGCNGGSALNAFQYVIVNKGVDTEASYPFTGNNASGECNYQVLNRGGGCSEIQQMPAGNEEILADASSVYGPITAAIDASQPTFQFYSSGMYDEPNCNSTSLNHVVTIIGYGFENAGNYWLVRNSWGGTWGDRGYVQMAKDKSNQCGIASQTSFCLY